MFTTYEKENMYLMFVLFNNLLSKKNDCDVGGVSLSFKLTSELRMMRIFLAPFGINIIFVFPILFIFLSNSRLRTLHLDPSPPQTPHRSSSTGESLIYITLVKNYTEIRRLSFQT